MSGISQQGAEPLFNSIDGLIDKKLENISYDKTEICKIISIDKDNPNCYWVSNEAGTRYQAYSLGDSNEYITGIRVYVMIPQGNYELQKIILGVYTSDQAISTSTFDDYYWDVDFTPKDKIQAGNTEEIDTPDFSNLIEYYDSMCIRVAYETGVSDDNGEFSETFFVGARNQNPKEIEEEEIKEGATYRKIEEEEKEEGTTYRIFVTEEYEPEPFTYYNQKKVDEALYKFVTELKGQKGKVFDLNEDGKVDMEDYSIFKDIVGKKISNNLTSEQTEYFKVFADNGYDVISVHTRTHFARLLEWGYTTISATHLKQYFFQHQKELSSIGYSYTDLFPQTIQSLINQTYFNKQMVLGNPQYLTLDNYSNYYYDISSNNHNFYKINTLQTTCKATGNYSNENFKMHFKPTIYFGYKKEKSNMVKLFSNEDITPTCWFNLYLANDQTMVYNYKTLENKDEDIVNLLTERNIKLLTEKAPENEILREGKTYLVLDGLMINWQRFNTSNAKWENISDPVSAGKYTSYRYEYDKGSKNDKKTTTTIRVVITKENDDFFKIISNTIQIEEKVAASVPEPAPASNEEEESEING